MDLDLIGNVLERAVVSLGLDAPLRPWWLGETRPPRPARLSRTLASACPNAGEIGANVELEPEVLGAFRREDRDAIARQIDASFRHLLVFSDAPDAPDDDATVVHVQLGLPLIGRDRVLLRICTRNVYGDARAPQTVTSDFHAWLTPTGALPDALRPPERALATIWEHWTVGHSPGLRAP